jgi:hypothetical protein
MGRALRVQSHKCLFNFAQFPDLLEGKFLWTTAGTESRAVTTGDQSVEDA